MQSALLTTKLHIPSPRPELVPRAHLIEQLNHGFNKKLILISAPAGFGKTTLVSDWIANCERDVAWLQLDEEDNDTLRFLTYLIAALQTIHEDVGKVTASLLQAPQTPSLENLITPLINDLSSLPTSTVLVLDDYHLIANLDVHRILNVLLDHAPDLLQLVIVSREDPPLPLHRLRADNQLTEIRAHDLRFAQRETEQFFEQTMALDLDPQIIATLDARTEGWIAGLQMAALSLRGVTDVEGFVEAFTGDHRYVADYLISEVLDRQPEDVRQFLLETSILDRFTASLCQELVGDLALSAFEMIEHIEASGLFIMPLDHVRKWYRYHQLFADLLRHRLRRSDPERFISLHRQAGRWYQEQGLIDEAVHHALNGEDYDLVADLLEETGLGMIGRSQLPRLRRWIEALPEGTIADRPYLSLLLTWVGALTGDLELSRIQLASAEANMDKAAHELLPEIRCQIALLYAYAARSREDLDAATRFAQDALHHLPPDNTFLDCTIHLNLGGNYWLDGSFDKAEMPLNRAFSFLHVSEVEYPVLAAAGFLANTYLHQGQLNKAEILCAQVVEYERDRSHPATAYIYLEHGELLYEKNELEGATDRLLQAIRLGETTDRIVNVIRARLLLAQIYQIMGNYDEGTELIEQAVRRYHQGGPHYQTMHEIEYAYYWVRCQLAGNNLPGARRWAQEYAAQEMAITPWATLSQLAYARVLLADTRPDEALPFLRSCEDGAQSVGAQGWVIQSLVLQAVAYQAIDKPDMAVDRLYIALSLAQPKGYVRTFVDMGQPMADLLANILLQAKDDTRPTITSHYVTQLLTIIRAEIDRQPQLIEPLTARELDILRLISAGFSNQEIADQLVITLGTVKQYNHAIFRKLDVASRDEAARRARELRLL